MGQGGGLGTGYRPAQPMDPTVALSLGAIKACILRGLRKQIEPFGREVECLHDLLREDALPPDVAVLLLTQIIPLFNSLEAERENAEGIRMRQHLVTDFLSRQEQGVDSEERVKLVLAVAGRFDRQHMQELLQQTDALSRAVLDDIDLILGPI